MKHRLPVLVLVPVAVLSAYAASPFLSLYEMSQAMRSGDIGALSAGVAWNEVREGLKEDIADGITGDPQATQLASNSDDLPAFGASFVTGMAGNIVDRTVTPEHLASALGTLRAAGFSVRPTLISAHFTSPTNFEIAFRTPQERAGDAPLRLRLTLQTGPDGVGWRVTRAWVPETVLGQTDTHAS